MSANDRKLIELAAKAAGISVKYNTHWSGFERQDMADEFGRGVVWNPLNNDGDAFRLMVSLGIEVNRVNCMQKTICFYSRHGAIIQFDEQSNCDPCASTRRAIVRAAAASGEQLEGNE